MRSPCQALVDGHSGRLRRLPTGLIFWPSRVTEQPYVTLMRLPGDPHAHRFPSISRSDLECRSGTGNRDLLVTRKRHPLACAAGSNSCDAGGPRCIFRAVAAAAEATIRASRWRARGHRDARGRTAPAGGSVETLKADARNVAGNDPRCHTLNMDDAQLQSAQPDAQHQSPHGKEVFERLLRRCDVLVENFGPSARTRPIMLCWKSATTTGSAPYEVPLRDASCLSPSAAAGSGGYAESLDPACRT